MGILDKWRVRRRGPHRKVLGRFGSTLSGDRMVSSSSSENGSEIAEIFSRSELFAVSLIELTRPDCFSAAMILTSSSGAGESILEKPPYCKTIGRTGQSSKTFKTGAPGFKWRRRFNPRGDVCTICRHL